MSVGRDDVRDKALIELTKKLVDEGKLIEAGWVGLYVMAVPADASEEQVRVMRQAFMAGAQHLWASIFAILDAGEEATEADLARLGLIAAELEAFHDEVMAAAERGYW
jgi:hypothetical protein